MKLVLPYTWRQARSRNFNIDALKREGKRIRTKVSNVFVPGFDDDKLGELHSWVTEHKTTYSMYGVFENTRSKDFSFMGLLFDLPKDDELLFFKLRFT